MERADELKERIRQQPLNDRLEESRRRIGDMCSKGRCPKMTIPAHHDDDDFYINTTLADAQAAIAALQARVQELEARQHFGACAKCLTNAWRICKEGTPDAVEMKCSNGSTWWLCDYCLSKEQLTQRTAELEAAKQHHEQSENAAQLYYRELTRVKNRICEAAGLPLDSGYEPAIKHLQAELERVRALIKALPKVEGAVVVSNGYVKDSTRCHALFGADEDAALYAALLQHRQGMEGV